MTLKSTLHLAAISSIQHNPDLKKYFERKVSEGKSKMCVINAVRDKSFIGSWQWLKEGHRIKMSYKRDLD